MTRTWDSFYGSKRGKTRLRAS